MSTIVYRKRSFFEGLPTTPLVSKRIRCSSSSSIRSLPPRSISPSPSQSQSLASQASVLDYLKVIFPDMDKQFLEKALEECGNDLDSVIKSLNELRLGSTENNLGFRVGTSKVGLEIKVQLQSQGVAATNGEVGVNGSIEDWESSSAWSLGDLPPEVLNYIQKLELELSTAKKELDAQKQENMQIEYEKGNNNNLLEYLRASKSLFWTHLRNA